MWPNPQFPADLVKFTEKILNGKLHFCAVANETFIWLPRPYMDALCTSKFGFVSTGSTDSLKTV